MTLLVLQWMWEHEEEWMSMVEFTELWSCLPGKEGEGSESINGDPGPLLAQHCPWLFWGYWSRTHCQMHVT